MTTIKVLLRGDVASGKTVMLVSYINNAFPDEYVPTVFDNYATDVLFEDGGETRPIHLSIWDAADQEAYDRFIPLASSYASSSYPRVDAVLICFSIVKPHTFEHVRKKWWTYRHHDPETPVILVGNMSDLREDQNILERLKKQNQQPISYRQGA